MWAGPVQCLPHEQCPGALQSWYLWCTSARAKLQDQAVQNVGARSVLTTCVTVEDAQIQHTAIEFRATYAELCCSTATTHSARIWAALTYVNTLIQHAPGFHWWCYLQTRQHSTGQRCSCPEQRAGMQHRNRGDAPGRLVLRHTLHRHHWQHRLVVTFNRTVWLLLHEAATNQANIVRGCVHTPVCTLIQFNSIAVCHGTGMQHNPKREPPFLRKDARGAHCIPCRDSHGGEWRLWHFVALRATKQDRSASHRVDGLDG